MKTHCIKDDCRLFENCRPDLVGVPPCANNREPVQQADNNGYTGAKPHPMPSIEDFEKWVSGDCHTKSDQEIYEWFAMYWDSPKCSSHNERSQVVTIKCTCGKRAATVHLCEECFFAAATA